MLQIDIFRSFQEAPKGKRWNRRACVKVLIAANANLHVHVEQKPLNTHSTALWVVAKDQSKKFRKQPKANKNVSIQSQEHWKQLVLNQPVRDVQYCK